ncbi:DNA topoisomerase III [Veillonella parvula HSIVP1]|nr:DNA topoisomerase [Veillonella parvula]EQC63503.1 DNA topoisomerase III [Veillonella parvula HSIVP1]
MELKSKLVITVLTGALAISGIASTQANGPLNNMIRHAALKYNVDPVLLTSLIDQESSFNQNAVSPAGAVGYGQLMPDTAAELGVDPYDPEQNIDGSARYLRQMLDSNGGNVKLALAAYNAGQGAVNQYGGIPPYEETQDYVSSVMSGYRDNLATDGALPTPPPAARPSKPKKGVKKRVVVYHPLAHTQPTTQKKQILMYFYIKNEVSYMNLYITEKPSVARIIKDYLNNSGANFKSTATNKKTDSPFFFDSNGNCIAWCTGHLLRLLDPKEYDPKYASWDETLLPIYPEELKKCTRATTKALYKHLQKQIKAATTVYHLGDPDREGCLIVDEILKQEGFTGTVKRILLNALDETSVQNAFSSIQDNSDFQTMTAAAESRAAIDWLIGINLTRFFTRIGQHSGNAGTLPVGRVKAPVLKLVYDRDMSIEQFVPTTYYTVDAYINGKTKITLEHDDIFEKELADRIKSEIEGKEATVSELEREITNHFVTSLFSLDTLQVELNKRHAISPSNTLAAAQALYEKGYITYPRSDCKYLPDSQKEQAAGIIHNLLSNERVTVAVTDESVFTTDKKPIYNTSKVIAHHAIIPTVKELTKEVLETFSTDEQTVYLEVAKRYLAAHYTKPLVKEKLEATIEVANTAYTMKLSETQVRDEGYKILYIDLLPPEEIYAEEPIPFPIEQGDTFTLKDVFVTDHVTKPPKPFTEGTLLSAMNHIDKYAYNASESQLQTLKSVKGIGTPATRATIISDLLDPKNPLLYKKEKPFMLHQQGLT